MKIFSAIIILLALLSLILNFYADVSKIIVLIGLMGIISGKEKNENEKIAKIRGKVFQISFIILFAIFFSQLFIQVLDENYIITNNMIFIGLIFSVFVYLIAFNLAILSKKTDYFFEDKVLSENIKKNSRFYLIYSSFIILLIVFLLIIDK